jgi:hypothetical protein
MGKKPSYTSDKRHQATEMVRGFLYKTNIHQTNGCFWALWSHFRWHVSMSEEIYIHTSLVDDSVSIDHHFMLARRPETIAGTLHSYIPDVNTGKCVQVAIISPLFCGLRPKLELIIARSISATICFSQG